MTATAGGQPSQKRIIGARAVVDSTRVDRILLKSFKEAVDDHPKALSQLVRVVARRLQRITFLVMYRSVVLHIHSNLI
jgi:CRP-like cAMP-binding protein